MKKLITLLFLVIGFTSYGQITTNPDIVCIDAVGEQYFVTNSPGSTYSWTTTGTLASGQGTNAITIDWTGIAAGLYINAVTVTETTSSGCVGNPVTLNVNVLELILQAISSFCITDPSYTLSANVTGGTFSGNGIVGNDFDPSIAGAGTHVITYSLNGCSVTTNITVNSIPTTGLIQHY